ncbi:TPA: hypothetical protein P9I69_000222 [Klebsiella pneumoniae]|uniref:hypothetical protein n=1 Tax=Klebsiella pneumoniae TaxID=573 RepID=UPI00108416BC|nr:hypothetical protein [Klebsiella pneumoniae]VGC88199.1 Uncharacterised protein [Klebsiella pneumoniae]HBW3560789.1 hypothetical protein [Klebsiella pneumoniae]HBW8255866.1 hypothetical protein [Klebsiella pneumoniae]HCU0483063.1 hypothetical protein [Klebsiella pneumoniae]HDQ4809257.1 hypothetical protein [Klebsiella pneumoniae]
MHKTTAVIDSPEALGLALCRHVPDMANGFTITTRDSQLQLTITAEDTRPFMVAMERLLKGKIRHIQRGHQGRVLDEKWDQIEATNQIFAEQVRREDKTVANNLQIIERIKSGGERLNELAIKQIVQISFPTLTSEERERIDQIIRAAALRKKTESTTSI